MTNDAQATHNGNMTEQTHERIPELTLGWRLKMALGDTPAQEMADVLGYSRQQLSRWMSDKGAPPRNGVLNQWALVTGVPAEWLKTGKNPTEPEPDGDQRKWAPRDSNPQPTDIEQSRSHLQLLPDLAAA